MAFAESMTLPPPTASTKSTFSLPHSSMPSLPPHPPITTPRPNYPTLPQTTSQQADDPVLSQGWVLPAVIVTIIVLLLILLLMAVAES